MLVIQNNRKNRRSKWIRNDLWLNSRLVQNLDIYLYAELNLNSIIQLNAQVKLIEICQWAFATNRKLRNEKA